MARIAAITIALLVPCAQAIAAPRVAVMSFTDASSETGYAALGKGLQSMLTSDLSQIPDLKLVERARLQELQKEIALGKTGGFDKKTTARASCSARRIWWSALSPWLAPRCASTRGSSP